MMQQKEIFKKIGGIIAELTEQYQYLSENPEQLNDLELELFSANSDFLAEHVKVLKKVNLSALAQKQIPLELPASSENKEQPLKTDEIIENPAPQKEEPLITQDTREFVSVIPEKEDLPFEVPASENIPEPIVSEPASVISEPVSVLPDPPVSIVPEIRPEFEAEMSQPMHPAVEMPSLTETPSSRISEPPSEEPVRKEVTTSVPVVEESFQKETINIAEATQSRPQTINELISAQIKKSFSEEPQSNMPPISDLKSAINLNDKLLFIKDLFNGYSLAYSEAIELLNRFESFNVAETFLKANYAAKNNWAAKQGTVDKFYEFLHRRYAK